MDKPDAPAAVMGTFVRIQTMSDGTPRIVLDLDCSLAQVASLGLEPGAPIAIARVTQHAAREDARRKATASAMPNYGKHYAVLYRHGWWHNPKVAAAFEVPADASPDERIKHIKERIYLETASESMSEIEPHFFVQLCAMLDILDTVPREIREAA